MTAPSRPCFPPPTLRSLLESLLYLSEKLFSHCWQRGAQVVRYAVEPWNQDSSGRLESAQIQRTNKNGFMEWPDEAKRRALII